MTSLALSYWHDDAMAHRYVWASDDIEAVFTRPLYRALIASDALQRLADIRFLGAIDYFIHPNGKQLNRRRHNRLEHTLGVANLALHFARSHSLRERDEMLVVTAALLHDVGHSPLSHSLEAVFKSSFGMDHHEAGRAIILGRAPNSFGSSVIEELRLSSIDPQRVLDLIDGTSTEWFAFLFSHPLNIDTMEAISRSETYIKHSRTSPSPEDILHVLVAKDSPAGQLDKFWELKDSVYRLLIQGPVGILADYVARNHVEKNIGSFSAVDYFKSERELRRSNPGLFAVLEATRNNLKQSISTVSNDRPVSVVYNSRRFFLDSTKQDRDPARYKQSKTVCSVKLNELLDLNVRAKAEPIKFELD